MSELTELWRAGERIERDRARLLRDQIHEKILRALQKGEDAGVCPSVHAHAGVAKYSQAVVIKFECDGVEFEIHPVAATLRASQARNIYGLDPFLKALKSKDE